MTTNEINGTATIALIAITLLAGLILDWLARPRLRRWAEAHNRIVIEAIAIALGGQFTFWSLVIALLFLADPFIDAAILPLGSRCSISPLCWRLLSLWCGC